MDYIPLPEYRYAWFFKHQEMPVPSEALSQIKPLSEASANQVWLQLISKKVNHPDLFLKDDWPSQQQTWQVTQQWQQQWESDDSDMPEIIDEYLQWEGNTIVYFCYHADNIIETTWDIFRAHWKNFLFLDNGPILLGKRRNEVLQFFEDDQLKIGIKGQV
jgi:hypothetical protein